MKTLALVIGNDEYHTNVKLNNAVNDAIAIEEEFKKLGFDVISKMNCKAESISNLLDEFSNKISSYDASIFYFAGHGFEKEGENYFASIDCQIPPSKHEANRSCIRLNELLDIYKANVDKVNIVIIDACRKSFDRSGNVSLAPVSAPQGSLIAFSTSPNDSASDAGFEGHSIYTGALLQYLGRERLSVEELFKKVRKTVYELSNGMQITWEHTSLINDYYFNTGQRVYSVNIPYDDKVVKDINYDESDEFGNLIKELKSYNWHIQNPAISKLLALKNLDKNQQFILGRNLLQASSAHNASNFFDDIKNRVIKYSKNGENHLLEGILFEIYFNAYGEFRRDRTKQHFLDKILSLRKEDSLESSFKFIERLLKNENYDLIYIPEKDDKIIDVNVLARLQQEDDREDRQIIEKITFNNIDITNDIRAYMYYERTEEDLKNAISVFFTAPKQLINIHSNLILNNIYFNYS